MKAAFQPIIDNNCIILILGTMPGEESLCKQEYYAHKTNQFWRIIFAIFNTPVISNYETKKHLLLRNKIALWDVLAYCKREGSADSAIQCEIPNNFDKLYTEYPNLKYICFASKKAEEYYKKYIGKSESKEYYTLSSPSSAYASKSFDKKVEDWSIINKLLNYR